MPVSVKILGVLSDFKRTLPKFLQAGKIIFFNGIKHTRKIVLALRRSYERFTGVLEWGGIIILLSRLNAAESVLRGHTGHCRGCFVKCLQTGEIIFFNGIKYTRKIVLAPDCSYLRFTAFLGRGGIIILLPPFLSNLGRFRGVLSDFKSRLSKACFGAWKYLLFSVWKSIII